MTGPRATTVNIGLTVVVLVVFVVVFCCCCDWTMSLSTFFFQSYHDGQLSLLLSTSRLHVLSEQCVLSSVTENQWQGENNLYESM